MDELEVRETEIQEGWHDKVFFINGKPLYEYFQEWTDIYKPEQLAVCWSEKVDYKGDIRFVRYCLSQEHANVPILMCPDDMDFSCTVIVAEVIKNDKTVTWNRIGSVLRTNWKPEDEQRSGVLMVEKYSDEDWERFEDTFVNANVYSPEYQKYVSENWDDELFRRRMNHTFPYYQEDKNINWFSKCSFVFDRTKYEKLVESCYS